MRYDFDPKAFRNVIGEEAGPSNISFMLASKRGEQVTPQSAGAWLAGKSVPNALNLLLMAEVYGTDEIAKAATLVRETFFRATEQER